MLEQKALPILKDELEHRQIHTHAVSSRIKPVQSFLDKVRRNKPSYPLEEINDILGLRVVCLFQSDLYCVRKVIHDCFEMFSEHNKIDSMEVNAFGYFGFHFIVGLREKDIASNSELRGILFEIQVRTICMDVWATMSHYLDYKIPKGIPEDLRRDFYALSGVLYSVESQFQALAHKTKKARKTDSQKSLPDLDQVIDSNNLGQYLHWRFPDREHVCGPVWVVRDRLLQKYKTLKDLDQVVAKSLNALLLYEKERPPQGGSRFVDIGALEMILLILHEHELDDRFDYYKKYRDLIK
jgi:ppGpp synthetase/RelA/SpoT-type nucleotidyltranferase